MNGKILGDIATATNGAYVPAGTKRVNMADVYHGYVENVEQTEFETAKINSYIPRFQWFAVPALVLLLVEVVWSTRVGKRAKSQQVSPGSRQSLRRAEKSIENQTSSQTVQQTANQAA
jgi:Ca-activated chloride channel family protein